MHKCVASKISKHYQRQNEDESQDMQRFSQLIFIAAMVVWWKKNEKKNRDSESEREENKESMNCNAIQSHDAATYKCAE